MASPTVNLPPFPAELVRVFVDEVAGESFKSQAFDLAAAMATFLADTADHPALEELPDAVRFNVRSELTAWLEELAAAAVAWPFAAPRAAMDLGETLDAVVDWAAEWAGLRDGVACGFCDAFAGNDYHLAGVMEPGENNVVCVDCWDERLR